MARFIGGPPQQVGMSTANCGTITVVPDFDPALVTATCSLADTEVGVGEPAEVSYEVSNDNDGDAEVGVELLANGAVLDERRLLVFGQGSEDRTVEIEFEEEGEYQIAVELVEIDAS